MAISKASVFILLGILVGSQARWEEKNLIGNVLMFDSYRYPQYFISRRSSNVYLLKRNKKNHCLDSSWKIVKGLCGHGISFQSKKHPNRYLKHAGRSVYVETYYNTESFKREACFLFRRGLASQYDVSFESVGNYRGYYLRQQNYMLSIGRDSGDYQFRKDATFRPWSVYNC